MHILTPTHKTLPHTQTHRPSHLQTGSHTHTHRAAAGLAGKHQTPGEEGGQAFPTFRLHGYFRRQAKNRVQPRFFIQSSLHHRKCLQLWERMTTFPISPCLLLPAGLPCLYVFRRLNETVAPLNYEKHLHCHGGGGGGLTGRRQRLSSTPCFISFFSSSFVHPVVVRRRLAPGREKFEERFVISFFPER